MSLEEEDLTDDLVSSPLDDSLIKSLIKSSTKYYILLRQSGLSEHKLRLLEETYQSVYVKKYPVVGYMDYHKDDLEIETSSVKPEL